MAKAHDERVLADGLRGVACFRVFNGKDCVAMFALQPVKLRIALIFPVAKLLHYIRHLHIGQILGLFVSTFVGMLNRSGAPCSRVSGWSYIS